MNIEKPPLLTFLLAATIIAGHFVLNSNSFLSTAETIEMYEFSPEKMHNVLPYNFIHADYGHLFGNIAIILVAGFIIEQKMRRRDVLMLFFAGSALSAMVFALIQGKYSIIGSSAGAISMYTTAMAIDMKKTLGITIALLLLAAMVIYSMNFVFEMQQKKIKAEIETLRETAAYARRANDMSMEQQASEQIQEKTEAMEKIKKSVELKDTIPPSFEIHAIAAFFGAIYAYLFARKRILENYKELTKFLGVTSGG